uniref:Uncharacterized protein n=1 Tax=Glossina morsitans morsitans TaxID=37546 RepID=A0A1B0G9F7_GLOMM
MKFLIHVAVVIFSSHMISTRGSSTPPRNGATQMSLSQQAASSNPNQNSYGYRGNSNFGEPGFDNSQMKPMKSPREPSQPNQKLFVGNGDLGYSNFNYESSGSGFPGFSTTSKPKSEDKRESDFDNSQMKPMKSPKEPSQPNQKLFVGNGGLENSNFRYEISKPGYRGFSTTSKPKSEAKREPDFDNSQMKPMKSPREPSEPNQKLFVGNGGLENSNFRYEISKPGYRGFSTTSKPKSEAKREPDFDNSQMKPMKSPKEPSQPNQKLFVGNGDLGYSNFNYESSGSGFPGFSTTSKPKSEDKREPGFDNSQMKPMKSPKEPSQPNQKLFVGNGGLENSNFRYEISKPGYRGFSTTSKPKSEDKSAPNSYNSPNESYEVA